MPRWLKYAHRAIAVAYLLGWVLIATHSIGKQSSGDPMTWADAWTAVLWIATSGFVGWQAGRESKSSQ